MNELKFGLHSGPTRQCIYGDVNDENVESNETYESFQNRSTRAQSIENGSEGSMGSIKTNLTGKERNFLSPDVHTTFCVEVHQGKRLYK